MRKQWHIASNEFNINFALDHKEKKKSIEIR